MTKNNEQLEVLSSKADSLLNNIDTFAAQIAAQFPEQIGATEKSVLSGRYEGTLADDEGTFVVGYDQQDNPTSYTMSFLIDGSGGFATVARRIIIDNECVTLKDNYEPGGELVLYKRGESFANGIGPKRAKRTLGYLSILNTALESKLEQPEDQ